MIENFQSHLNASGLKTVENHILEEENHTLKCNKLSVTVTINRKRKINRFGYMKINIYIKQQLTHLYMKENLFKS